MFPARYCSRGTVNCNVCFFMFSCDDIHWLNTYSIQYRGGPPFKFTLSITMDCALNLNHFVGLHTDNWANLLPAYASVLFQKGLLSSLIPSKIIVLPLTSIVWQTYHQLQTHGLLFYSSGIQHITFNLNQLFLLRFLKDFP